MKDIPKWAQYATILGPHIAKVFTDEAEVQINIEELENEENLQAFFHALATVIPCDIFNKLVGDNKNHLQFNHTANMLCMGFMNIKKAGD